MKRVLLLSFAVLCLTLSLTAQRKSISSVVEKMQKIDGYVPVYFNPDDGKIYLEISRLNAEFLYLVSLPIGFSISLPATNGSHRSSGGTSFRMSQI